MNRSDGAKKVGPPQKNILDPLLISYEYHLPYLSCLRTLAGTSDTIIFLFLGMVLISEKHHVNWSFVLVTIILCTIYRFICNRKTMIKFLEKVHWNISINWNSKSSKTQENSNPRAIYNGLWWPQRSRWFLIRKDSLKNIFFKNVKLHRSGQDGKRDF